MSIATCTISGTVRNLYGNALAGVTVKANSDRPFIHPTDSSLITNYEVSTTTASDGTWSLTLIETETPDNTLTITFYYPAGSVTGNVRYEYTVQIPNTASATFASLIGTQV